MGTAGAGAGVGTGTGTGCGAGRGAAAGTGAGAGFIVDAALVATAGAGGATEGWSSSDESSSANKMLSMFSVFHTVFSQLTAVR
jgi:hypothetical protein